MDFFVQAQKSVPLPEMRMEARRQTPGDLDSRLLPQVLRREKQHEGLVALTHRHDGDYEDA